MASGNSKERPDRLDDPHVSLPRLMMSLGRGKRYVSFSTPNEVRAAPDGCVVLEGDYGGQIYVAVPAEEVRCNESDLKQLLVDLDALQWDDEDGARVVYEQRRTGSTVAGGMGGGVVAAGAWVHPRLLELGVGDQVRAVLSGARQRLSPRNRAAKPAPRPPRLP